MKKLLILLFLFFSQSIFAHTIILQTIDNEDGTMEIFGGFSTGTSATGAMLTIKSTIRTKILYKDRIPSSGTLIVKIPNEPYSILLDSGPGHKIEKKGDIIPKGGFKLIKNEKPLNIAFLITLLLSLFFIILSIILSVKKNKIQREQLLPNN